jgi:hypothetical protein
MYRLFLFLLTALNTTTLTAQNLTYTFSPGNVAGKPALHVAIDLDGLASGTTYLAYQDIQFGDPGQMSALQGVRVSKDATVSKDPDNNRLVLRHAPKARLLVEYDLVDLQQEAQPFYQYCCYNPIVHEDYFHVQAGHLLAIPEHYWSSPEDQKTVLLQWENFPKNWVLHNSFGPAAPLRGAGATCLLRHPRALEHADGRYADAALTAHRGGPSDLLERLCGQYLHGDFFTDL